MRKRVNVIINNCRDCPYFEENWASGHPFCPDFVYCEKTGRKIGEYKTLKIQEWCPLEDVEDEKNNQCDGCRRNLPLKNGIHYGKGYDMIVCTKDRYQEIKEETEKIRKEK